MALYKHATWCKSSSIVCEKGCAYCCTQSVTITSVESREILNFIYNNKRLCKKYREQKLVIIENEPVKPLMTTNQFATYYLNQNLPENEAKETWNFKPCIFLKEDSCSIYPVRPFGCRSFISLKNCVEFGSAEIPPLFLTLNTVWMQLIEHIDAGEYWGTLNDVIFVMSNEDKIVEQQKNKAKATAVRFANDRLLKNEKIGGFLIPQEELGRVRQIITRLFQEEIAGKPFAEHCSLSLEKCLLPAE